MKVYKDLADFELARYVGKQLAKPADERDLSGLPDPVRHFVEKMLAEPGKSLVAIHKAVELYLKNPPEPEPESQRVHMDPDRTVILDKGDPDKWGTAQNYAELVLRFSATGQSRSVADAKERARIADPEGYAAWLEAFGDAEENDDADADDEAIDADADADDDAGVAEEDDGDDDAADDGDADVAKKGAQPMSLEAHVSEIMKRDQCSRFVALDKVATEQPEALEVYQRDGIEKIEKVAAAARPPGPCGMQIVFDQIVAKVAGEHKLSRFEAMQKVERDHPEIIAGLNAA